MKRLFILIAVLASLITFTSPVRGQLLIGEALTELSVAGYNIDAQLKSHIAELQKIQTLDKFRANIQQVGRDIRNIQKKIKSEKDTAQSKIDSLKKQYVNYGDVSSWPADAQKEYQEAKKASDDMDKAKTKIDVVFDKAKNIWKWSTGVDANTFSKLSGVAIRQMKDLQNNVKSFAQDMKSMATAFPVAKAGPVKFENKSKDIDYYVNGRLIKPGTSDSIAMAAGREFEIRAEAMTKRRVFIKTKPLTAHATLNGDRTDYYFSFTIDTGAGPTTATWKVEKEEYTWNTATTKFKAENSVTSSKAKNDVMHWKAPVFTKYYSTQVFTIGVHGDMEWSYLREGAMPRKTDKEFESFYGDMVILVQPE